MPRKINLTDKKFGRLLVLEETPQRRNNSVVWKCKCDCGNDCFISSKGLRGGTESCGCLHLEHIHSGKKRKVEDISNKKFGSLTAIKPLNEKGSDRSVIWFCKCECGNEINVNGSNLRSGNTTSCGCVSSSIGEKNIEKVLQENNIDYIKEYRFSDLYDKDKGKQLRYDFAIIQNEKIARLIEFDGVQHTNENSKWFEEGIKRRDLLKNEYALNNNIPLIRIPYSERDRINIEMLLNNKFIYKGDR